MPVSATASRLVHELARPQPGVAPDERVGVAAEWLRTSPYACVPVLVNGNLRGVITDASLTEYLLSVPDDSDTERRRLLEAPVEPAVVVPLAALSPLIPLGQVCQILDREGRDSLPVADPDGFYYGMIGRADLVRELLRPLALPQIGGMATLFGVHLSTGAVRAGVPAWALVATGLFFFLAQLLLTGVLLILPGLPGTGPWYESLELLLSSLIMGGGLLLLVRLSPLAGYHAAEHQVVHALERHVPLLIEQVERMPRVHPRCGTNLMAGTFILGSGAVFSPLVGSAAYAATAVLALLYGRSFGSWLQEHLTTRPASAPQLAQAIAAAQELLRRQERSRLSPTPFQRLLHSGLLHLLAGFVLGGLLLALLAVLIPEGRQLLAPPARALLTW